MPFTRHLDDDFIKALNVLYGEGTWWKTLADDKAVFLAIRNDTLNAYSGGGSIARITHLGRGKIELRVHWEYLALPTIDKESPYILLQQHENKFQRRHVRDLGSFVEHLDAIKRRSAIFSGDERSGENEIACKNSCIIDMEVAFPKKKREAVETDEAENPEVELQDRKDDGRVDLVAVQEDVLHFIEAKLYSNSEIRSKSTPKVCQQLKKYHRRLVNDHKNVLEQYKKVAEYFHQLEGNFFRKRRAVLDNEQLQCNTTPLLLIFGYDGDQQNRLDKQIKKSIVDGAAQLIDGFGKGHLQSAGRAKSVESYHLNLAVPAQ